MGEELDVLDIVERLVRRISPIDDFLFVGHVRIDALQNA